MGLTKAVRAILGKPVDLDHYGKVYEVKAKSNGITYRISRKRWVLPHSHWGWKADPNTTHAVETEYGDDLTHMLVVLGWEWEDFE